jgi:hypothetical protein
MLALTTRIELIQKFYENGRNAEAALRAYRRSHNMRQGPCSRAALGKLVAKFEKTGSVANLKKRRGRRVSEDMAAEVALTVEEERATSHVGIVSARAVARRTGIPVETVRRTMKIALRLFPYRIHRVHALSAGDMERRYNFAMEFLARVEIDETWFGNILWSDEAHFTLHGTVHTKNCVIWAEENPRAIVQEPLHDEKVTVWCGFTQDFLLGPFFFEEPTQHGFKTVTVTGERYRRLLEQQVITSLQQRNILGEVVFMQDGAPPHVSRNVKALLQQHFGDRIISRHFPFEWPARSPDLTPADFWLWGYLKSRVYRHGLTTLVNLKAAIRHEIAMIPKEMLSAAIGNVLPRLEAVVAQHGAHIEQQL